MEFDSSKMGKPSREFVLWLDCMGTQCFMNRNMQTAANFIFKFHSIVASATKGKKYKLYPVMDGVYITTSECEDMLKVIGTIMKALAKEIISEKNVHFRYLAKGALAYGDIYHGTDIDASAFDQNVRDIIRKGSFLIGPPVIQANQQEKKAPPFGIAIHNSCKLSQSGLKFNSEWFDWMLKNGDDIIDPLEKAVKEYFKLFEDQTAFSGYGKEKI